MRTWLFWFAIFLALVGVTASYHVFKPLPQGLAAKASEQSVSKVRFLTDQTFVTGSGEVVIEQQIFDEILEMIRQAERFVLIDMFLFNDFLGNQSEAQVYRSLSWELTNALVERKTQRPEIHIQVISDSINTLYSGIQSAHFTVLERAGIPVTLTELPRLRDSNPLYSGFWRLFIKPFGNKPADTLPSPFHEGRVSLRSYLALLNFKANHRKLVITDREQELLALVTSANPHDGSSRHSNVALQFAGPAVVDLLESELAVLQFSNPERAQQARDFITTSGITRNTESHEDLSIQVLTERAVEESMLNLIALAQAGEYIDIAVFYLSDRHLVNALKDASRRGVHVRVLLDANKDAFGREKNGVPNRPVAHELNRAGVNVRWCNTQGEQCHSKWMMYRDAARGAAMVLGSTNFTRRNMHNLNLETSVILRGTTDAVPLQAAHNWFEAQWSNESDRLYSVDYAVYADERRVYYWLYRFMELSGMSTF